MFPKVRFDFVYVANTIHHVTSKENLFSQMRRALKPGGWFFSWDPLAYNPLINVYRKNGHEPFAPSMNSPSHLPTSNWPGNISKTFATANFGFQRSRFS